MLNSVNEKLKMELSYSKILNEQLERDSENLGVYNVRISRKYRELIVSCRESLYPDTRYQSEHKRRLGNLKEIYMEQIRM